MRHTESSTVRCSAAGDFHERPRTRLVLKSMRPCATSCSTSMVAPGFWQFVPHTCIGSLAGQVSDIQRGVLRSPCPGLGLRRASFLLSGNGDPKAHLAGTLPRWRTRFSGRAPDGSRFFKPRWIAFARTPEERELVAASDLSRLGVAQRRLKSTRPGHKTLACRAICS